jgi:hypothetical protein
MVIVTRRNFLLSTVALSVGCAERGTVPSAPIGADAKVRPPAVGQSWAYAKHDYFTGEVVDTQVERVSAVGQTIEIMSHSETAQDEPITYPSWGSSWVRKYMGNDRPAHRLPSDQSGFDPTVVADASTGTATTKTKANMTPADSTATKRVDYLRAEGACLEGRNYSVM